MAQPQATGTSLAPNVPGPAGLETPRPGASHAPMDTSLAMSDHANNTTTPLNVDGKSEKKRRKKKKRPPHKSKMITGYIIYASEIRKDVIKKYPDRDFGDISKLVGIEWKNLPQETKAAYEARAQEQNAKSKALAAEALELKRIDDAAREEEEQLLKRQRTEQYHHDGSRMSLGDGDYSNSFIIDANGHSRSMDSNSMQSVVQGGGTSGDDDNTSPMSPFVGRTNANSISSNGGLANGAGAGGGLSNMCLTSTPATMRHHPQANQNHTTSSNNNNVNNCHNISVNNHKSSNFHMQQQPLQVIQHQHQPTATTQVMHGSLQLKNSIVYRKPATVRLRPKVATTQTEPITWISREPKAPLKFSGKFLDYLTANNRPDYSATTPPGTPQTPEIPSQPQDSSTWLE